MRVRNIKDGVVVNESSGDEDNTSDVLLPIGGAPQDGADWLFVDNNVPVCEPILAEGNGEDGVEEANREEDRKESFTETLVSNMLNFCLDESEREDNEEAGPSGLQELETKPDPGKILNIGEEEPVSDANADEKCGMPMGVDLDDEVLPAGDWRESAETYLPEFIIQGPSTNNENRRIRVGKPVPLSADCLRLRTKLVSYDGQYIKCYPYVPATGELAYSGRFRSGSVEFKLHRESALLTSGLSYVARVELGPVEALDRATCFREAREIMWKNIKIVKVLLDDDLQESKKARSDFETIMGEVCSETITTLQNAENLLQLYNIVQKYKNNANKIMAAINENKYLSVRLKTIISQHAEKENKMNVRNYVFSSLSSFFGRPQSNWTDTLKNCTRDGLRTHKSKLLEKCPAAMKSDLSKLQDKLLLFVTANDLKLFADIINALDKDVFKPILPVLMKRCFKKISSIKEDHLRNVVPVTNHIYFFLCKSLLELANEVKVKAKVENLLEYNGNEWQMCDISAWKPDSTLDSCLKQQLGLLLSLVNHFEPGKYVPNNRFEYSFKVFRDFEPTEEMKLVIEQTNMALGNSWETEDNTVLPDELHVWICLLDDTIAHVFAKDQKNMQMFTCLLKLYMNFCLSGNFKRDSLESLRVITHNTLRYVAQAGPFICTDNTIDNDILLKQVGFMNSAILENRMAFNDYRDLIEVFTAYWKQRNEVISNVPAKLPGDYFKEDVKEIQTKLLQCMSQALDKKVELIEFISFCRVYDEFLIDLNDIPLDWYVRMPGEEQIDIFLLSKVLEKVDNKWKDSDLKCYKVANVKKFAQLYQVLNEEAEVPKHYLVEAIKILIGYIKDLAVKPTWTDGSALTESNQIGAMNLLITSVRSSLMYFKEQPDYLSFKRFLEESTMPFLTVINDSVSFADFKKRVLLIKESFWYIRNLNEINIDKALELCRLGNNEDFDEGFLREGYAKYVEQFEEYMKKYSDLECDDKITKIVSDVKGDVTKVLTSQWTLEFKQNKLPLILAGLSAVWALSTSKDVASTGQYLKPHCIQILCVLRLLSADSEEAGVKKHLAQVLTGQGKSLILGMTATILALFGHSVQIMCYSDYLAKRDADDFEEFYEFFSVDEMVEYETFADVATKQLGNVAGNAENYILKCLGMPNVRNYGKSMNAGNFKKKVLLIDEVDVFFTEKFYGKSYSQVICPKVPGLTLIQDKIWDLIVKGNWSAGFIKRKVKEFEGYSDHPDIRKLVEFINRPDTYTLLEASGEDLVEKTYTNKSLYISHLDRMISTALDVNQRVIDDPFLNRFRLNSQGNITCRTALGKYCDRTKAGYYNAFIYLKLTRGCSNPESDNFGYMMLDTGSISYAKLPENYPLILGVTGTLTTLNEYEQRAVKEHYQILNSSVMPSFFGGSNLKFNKFSNFSCFETETDWMNNIFSNINVAINQKRSVLVFFETDIKINAFMNEFSSQLDRLNVLTADTDEDDMEIFINDAGVAKTVTLATRDMGRGVDYKSSVAVEKNGGIHVIQSFFSKDLKEETQIKGRTARKDNQGSYELIVCIDHLRKQELVTDEIKFFSVNYDMLARSRKQLMTKEGATKDTQVNQALERHNKTIEFFKQVGGL
uniref:SecA family profile domain-containing protein n=1 Tax=Culex tarsalis TaxID=7177 RepID=A0A1Q3FLU5_CULTA